MVQTFFTVLIVVLVIACIALGILYFLGRRAQKRQVENEQLLEQAKQKATLMAIDKKMLPLNKVQGLPKQIYDQTPWYARRAKMPVVKAKVGPRIMTLIADPKVFDVLPLMSEVKVYVSGIYITDILGARSGAIAPPQKKKGFFARHFGKYVNAAQEEVKAEAKNNNKKKKN